MAFLTDRISGQNKWEREQIKSKKLTRMQNEMTAQIKGMWNEIQEYQP